MTIAELKSFKLLEKKIEKEKRARAYISRINHKYNKMRLREKNFVSKSSWSEYHVHVYYADSSHFLAKF